MKILKIIGVIFGVLILGGIAWNIFIRYRFHFKPVVSFIVNYRLIHSCDDLKSGCDEIRPIPKPLQNKKIIFNQNINIKFGPFENKSQINSAELDTLGFIETDQFPFGHKNIVDPSLNKRGYLKEREYKIIRAVYHYNCSYCIDSSDYSYIVLEDLNENRFISMLGDMNFSVAPAEDISWDERLPLYLEKNKDGNEILEARLEDIL